MKRRLFSGVRPGQAAECPRSNTVAAIDVVSALAIKHIRQGVEYSHPASSDQDVALSDGLQHCKRERYFRLTGLCDRSQLSSISDAV